MSKQNVNIDIAFLCATVKDWRAHFWRDAVSAFKSAEDLDQCNHKAEQNFKISLSSLLKIISTQFKSTQLFENDFTHSPLACPTVSVSYMRFKQSVIFMTFLILIRTIWKSGWFLPNQQGCWELTPAVSADIYRICWWRVRRHGDLETHGKREQSTKT